MSEWKEYKLKELCERITDGSHKSPKAHDKGFPMFSVKDMEEYGFSYRDCKRISEEDFQEMKRSGCVPQKDDILIAKDGSYLKQIFICTETREEAILSSIAIFRPNTHLVEPRFLMYLLKSPQVFNYIKINCVSGSAIPRIVLKSFKDVKMAIPTSIDTQRRIASILSSLDDKIAVNKKICENLEAQAQALFKHWFIDFAPFKDGKFVESELGMIPEGWRVGSIGDYCEVKSGYAFKSSWWTNNGDKVIKIKNISENGTLDLFDCSCVDSKNTTKAQDFKAKSGDLIIAMTGATIGKFNIVPKLDGDYYINQRVGKFFLGDNPIDKLPFIYTLLKRKNIINQIINKGIGSAQPNISGNDIESVKFAYNNEFIEKFNENFKTLFESIITYLQETSRLSTLRDSLLPKLMSGQIKV